MYKYLNKRMNSWVQRSVLYTTLTVGIIAAEAASYYVSPGGDDISGTGSNEAPWRTLSKARDAVAEHIKTLPDGVMTEDIVVYLRDGGYPLDSTLVLDADDGGNNGYRILWRNYPNEEPILSGGTLISGLSDPDNDGIYKAHVGTLEFRSLYINNQRVVRAQHPNVDYGESFHVLPIAWGKNTRNSFAMAGFYKDFVQLNLKHVQGPGELDYRDWRIDANGVVEFVGANGYREVRGKIIYYDDQQEWSSYFINLMFHKDEQEHRMGYDKYPFYFENSLVFVDRPGEWFLDRNGTNNVLYYMPRSEDLDTSSNIVSEILAPQGVNVLLSITNTQNIAFYGISFEHSAFDEVHAQRMTGLTYDVVEPEIVNGSNKPATDGTIELRHVRNIHFERNRFQHTGANAIVMHEGVKQFGAVGNIFTDIGDTAIVMHGGLFNKTGAFYYYVGDTNRPIENGPRIFSQNDALEDIVVRNNIIRGCGKQIRWGGGVFAGYPVRAYIDQNEFSDMLNGYVINVGWGAFSWIPSETPLLQRYNTIRNNEFFDVMSLSDDAGVVHTKSASSHYVLNTLMSGNWFHNIDTSAFRSHERGLGKWLFYLDNATANCVVSNNVSTDISGTAWGARGGGIGAGEWQFLQEADNRRATNNAFAHNYDETLLRNYIDDGSGATGDGIYETYDPTNQAIASRIISVKTNAGIQTAYNSLEEVLTEGSVGGNGAPKGEVSGLVAHWSMENHVLDETPHTQNLRLFGNVAYRTNTICGNASLWFGGTTNDYAVSSGYKGITNSSARTVTAWVRTTDTNGLICGWGRSASGKKWIIQLDSSGRLRVGVHKGYAVGTTPLNDGQWRHVAVTFEDDGSPNIIEAKLYVDGVRENISQSKARPVHTDAFLDVSIGGFSENMLSGNTYSGYLDDIRIYNRALLASEVRILANYDTDADSIPDRWEMSYFDKQIDGFMDADADGFSNLSEFISGHDPTHPESFFSIRSISSVGAGEKLAGKEFVINWDPVEGRKYNIYRSPDLLLPETLAGSVYYPQGSYTDIVHGLHAGFYRVDVQLIY